MKKLSVVLNGPPMSGKDVAAKHLISALKNSRHIQFKDHLFDCTCVLFRVSKHDFLSLYNSRATKDSPCRELNGLSPRQAVIFTAEEVIKPKFGRDYFGISAAKNVSPGINIFSDAGFKEEIETIKQESDDTLIVQIYREGCSFHADSRDYVSVDGCKIIKLYNNSSLKDFLTDLTNEICMFCETAKENDCGS